jgi:hypothetical protein
MEKIEARGNHQEAKDMVTPGAAIILEEKHAKGPPKNWTEVIRT